MKTVGIIGGGQLGKMMILDGKRLDTKFIILDPTQHCPAHGIADKHIVANFDDIDAIMYLANQVDVVTYEFEHISLEALKRIEEKRRKVYPASKTLSHIQNKLQQKEWLSNHRIPVPEFVGVEATVESIKKACEKFGYPTILKTCTGGYDGKGNALIHDETEIESALMQLGNGALPMMCERFIPFEKEVSILVCRSIHGNISIFPVAENKHKNSILDETTAPANIPIATTNEAIEVAKKCVEAFDAYGMLCIELFVTNDQHVLVNELAPRPHNSGHYTIEGCYTSQYEQHIRAILGYPLGNATLIRPTAMKNIIGETDGSGNIIGLDNAYKNPNVKIHMYGKEKRSLGRKMGHITATGATIEEALEEVRQAYSSISFEA